MVPSVLGSLTVQVVFNDAHRVKTGGGGLRSEKYSHKNAIKHEKGPPP